ncbi:hypothetical protein BH09PSE1_BH09PSE1_02240 [soil metagenome]
MHTGRTVTFAPTEAARAVDKPQIKELLSLKTGKFLDARTFISGRRYDSIIRLRNTIREAMQSGPPRVVCSLCRVAAYIVSSKDKAFFFRHATEDGSCPAVTRDFQTESQIAARKYAGLPESEPHKRLKRLLMRSIEADPAFSDSAEERHWRATVPELGHRRPDVSGTYGGLRLAFEAQLSTTFLSVITGRRVFYRAEGALLVWILASFDPYHRRLTEDDIVFPNNSNALVVDDETTAASVAAGRFMVRCWHRVPDSASDWRSEIVDFSALTLDTVDQRAFLVDVEGLEKAARAKAQADERIAQAHARDAEIATSEARDQALRSEFIAYWSSPFETRGGFEQRQIDWAAFLARFSRAGIPFPPECWSDPDLDRWMKMVLTAQAGVPVGWNYKRLPEVAHHLHDRSPDKLRAFFHMLNHYGHAETLRAEDSTGKWQAKALRTRKEIEAGSARYDSVCSWDTLLAFLFPEIFHAFFKIT